MKILNLIAMLSLLLQACGGQNPTQMDIIGKWESSDGASFSFTKDGEFSGTFLPGQYFTFFTSEKEVQGKRIEGKGHWKLTKGQQFTEIRLSFDTINQQPILGLYTLLMAGKKGILDNKPPWYLFVWEEEEGGERYKFTKRQ